MAVAADNGMRDISRMEIKYTLHSLNYRIVESIHAISQIPGPMIIQCSSACRSRYPGLLVVRLLPEPSSMDTDYKSIWYHRSDLDIILDIHMLMASGSSTPNLTQNNTVT